MPILTLLGIVALVVSLATRRHERIHYASSLAVAGLLLLLICAAIVTFQGLAARSLVTQSRYRVIFRQHPLPMVIHSVADLRIVDANRAAVRQYGRDLDELRSLTVTDLRPPADGHGLAGFTATDSAEFVGLWTHRRSDGTLFVAEVATIPLEGRDSDLRLSVISDITERERNLHRLSAQEALFRGVTESLSEAVLVTDLGGRVTYANRRFEEITGRTAADVVGHVVQDELEDTRATTERRLAERRHGVSENYLQQFERPDGQKVWLEVHSSPYLGIDGRIEGVVAAFSNATARVETERAVRDSERTLRSLLQQVPALVWTTNQDLEFTALQGSIVGDQELDLPSVRELVLAGGLGSRALGAHQEALTGRPVSYEIDVEDRNFRCRVEPCRDGAGNLMGVIGVAVDVTESKRAEAVHKSLDDQLRNAQKMEAVGRLAGGIAHDFNNLLTIIEGNSDLLLDEFDSEPVELSEIREAAQSAASLTRQLLAFSRQQRLQPSVFEFDEAVAEASSLLKRVIGEDVELVHVSLSEHARFEGDRSQIHQMLLNLAINARDAMPKGGRLEIQTDLYRVECPAQVDADALPRNESNVLPESGDYVRLRISDNGVGMDEGTLEHAFEPFFSTKKADIGTGLGLATVYGIVRQSGGHVSAESEVGVGTTFTILLPRSFKDIGPAPMPRSEVTVAPASARLLLVEDEAGVRRMLARGLRRRGYDVLEASCGQEALRLATQSDPPIELVITDVLMPDMTGTELADHLLQSSMAPRILFISGYTHNALGSQHETIDFLPKPFSVQNLAERLQEILGRPRVAADACTGSDA